MRIMVGMVATLALLAWTPGAQGATVLRSCDVFFCEETLTFSASPGEVNVVEGAITNNSGRRIWLLDRNQPISLAEAEGPFRGNGCVHPARNDREWPFQDRGSTENVVACRWGGDGRVQMSLGDGDDVAFSITAQGGVVHGGSGDDVITGVDGSLLGESGNDRLTGSDRPDRLDGGPGDDELDGSLAGDVLRGGTGHDLVRWYRPLRSPGRGPVHVTVGTGADDGNAGDAGNPYEDLDAPGLDDVGADIEIVEGRPGGDVLIGSDGSEELRGNGGDDTLAGGGGDDDLLGGDGRDQLDGGQGDDLLDGGPGAATGDGLSGGLGIDLATYALRRAGVWVTLDDVADDGQPGEGDDVRSDVEHVLGGAGPDELTGSARDNELIGGPGDDLLRGLGGADVFIGTSGRDAVTYDERKAGVRVSIDSFPNDGARGKVGGSLEGDDVRPDVEAVIGSSGDDLLLAGKGQHTLFGGPGDDFFLARDSTRDQVHGGDGDDSAELDQIDVTRSIEHLLP